MTKEIKNEKEDINTFSNVSLVFSSMSLIIAAIPFGFIAFCCALGAIVNKERKSALALVLSIILPTISLILAILIFMM